MNPDRLGKCALTIAIAISGTSPAWADPPGVADDPEAATALAALDRPSGACGEVLGVPVTEDGSLPSPKTGYQLVIFGEDYPYTCCAQIAVLVKTKVDIEQALLERIRGDQPFCVRYRALYILAEREPHKAVRTIEAWWANPKPLYRLAAWRIAVQLVQRSVVLATVDQQAVLRAYAAEQEPAIRKEIATFLGLAKAEFAVDALVDHLPGSRRTAAERDFRATIEESLGPGAINASVDADIRSIFEKKRPTEPETGYGEGIATVWALGRIGDRRAAEPIIAAARENVSWGSVCYEALGRIGSDEAVEFLITRVGDPSAVRALGMTQSKKAVPALERLQVEMRTARDCDDPERRPPAACGSIALYWLDSDFLDFIRIALLQTEHPDPVDALLAIAENPQESEQARRRAIEALEPLDFSASVDRIVRLCQSTDNDFIWLSSAELLAGRRDAGVARALIALLNGPRPDGKMGLAAESIMANALEASQDAGGVGLDDPPEPR